MTEFDQMAAESIRRHRVFAARARIGLWAVGIALWAAIAAAVLR